MFKLQLIPFMCVLYVFYFLSIRFSHFLWHLKNNNLIPDCAALLQRDSKLQLDVRHRVRPGPRGHPATQVNVGQSSGQVQQTDGRHVDADGPVHELPALPKFDLHRSAADHSDLSDGQQGSDLHPPRKRELRRRPRQLWKAENAGKRSESFSFWFRVH